MKESHDTADVCKTSNDSPVRLNITELEEVFFRTHLVSKPSVVHTDKEGPQSRTGCK